MSRCATDRTLCVVVFHALEIARYSLRKIFQKTSASSLILFDPFCAFLYSSTLQAGLFLSIEEFLIDTTRNPQASVLVLLTFWEGYGCFNEW